jgi:hypothetical protein
MNENYHDKVQFSNNDCPNRVLLVILRKFKSKMDVFISKKVYRISLKFENLLTFNFS